MEVQMKITDLKLGTKLELELNYSADSGNKILLISEFEWAEDNDEAIIAVPIREGKYYPLDIGMTVTVYFNHNCDFYRFSADVLGRIVKEKLPLIKIRVNSDFERIQRRQFFRFNCIIPVKYRIVAFSGNSKINESPLTNAVTRDLSGGGLCLAVREKIETNKIVECDLFITEGKVINFLGKVLRLSDHEEKGIYKYEAGIEYIKIDDKCRESIIGYIFQEQRKLIKKGLV
jgi:c-di-GMP-binding flagellar brake protein YcgR